MESGKQFLERCAASSVHRMIKDDPDYARLFDLALRGAETQWRPIEEAPKDGAHILAWFSDCYPPTTMHWFGPAGLPGSQGGGWYVSVQDLDGNSRRHPTHFVLLTPLGEPK